VTILKEIIFTLIFLIDKKHPFGIRSCLLRWRRKIKPLGQEDIEAETKEDL
jgi:hypothetical protein